MSERATKPKELTQSKLTRLVHPVIHALRQALRNPMLVKDFRAQMSGPRAFKILTGYLVGLSGLAYAIYRILMVLVSTRFGWGNAPQSAFIGQAIFVSLAFLEMAFISFVTPALTASTISGEVERRTYDMLFATPLRPGRILWGKVVTALSYIMLLIVASIPLSSLIFLFGGVAVHDMIQAIGLFIVVAVTYGMVGIFFSALTRRTAQATVLSYVVVLALNLGTMFLWGLARAMNTETGQAPISILYLNPFSALISAILTTQSANPLMSMGPILGLVLEITGGTTILGLYSPYVPGRPLWQYTVTLYGALSIVLYLLTTQLIKPVRRWKIGRRGWVGLAIIVLVLCGVFGYLFNFEQHIPRKAALTPTPPPAVIPVIREMGIKRPPN